MANEFIVRKGLISIGGDVIINRDNGNYNFTIESPGDSNLFVANYTNNNITIGNTASANYKLGAWSASSTYTIYSYNSNSSDGTAIYGTATGSGNNNYAVRAEALNADLNNFGGYFTTFGSQYNYAVKGEASDASAQNFGGHFTAGNTFISKGARSSYGIYASSSENTTNGVAFGGYFTTSYTGVSGSSYGISVVDTSSSTGNAKYYGISVLMQGDFGIGTTNSYGIYVNNVTSFGDNTYAIYTVEGDNYLNQTSGRTGIGIAPSSVLTLKAGTSSAGYAPLKLTTGDVLSTVEVGAIEYSSPILYFTNGDSARLRIPTMRFVYLDDVQSRTLTTTYSTLSGLSVSLTAGRRYEIEAFISIVSVSGPGAKLKFSYTGTMTAINIFSYTLSDANTIIESRTTTGTTFAGDEVTSGSIANAGFFCKGHIWAATSDTLTLQAAQNTSSPSTAYFDRGGFIKVTPII